MAGKTRASFMKSSRERDKRRKREEKLQRKLSRRQETKIRKHPELWHEGTGDPEELGGAEPAASDEERVGP